MRAPRPSGSGFTYALSKRTVPWAPLCSTVLALAALWRCGWAVPRELRFRARHNRENERTVRLRHVGLRAQNEVRAPRPSGSGFTYALSKRTVPWAPLCSTVLALAALWRCGWAVPRELRFRARHNRENERTVSLAPRWVTSPKRGARAPAER